MHRARIAGTAGLVASLLFLAGTALAQERSAKVSPPRADRAAVATTTKARIQEVKGEVKDQIREIRETAKERAQAVREETRERAKVELEKAKERIKEIRDMKQQEKMQKLAERLGKINTTWTEHFMKVLERLSAVIEKMQKRVDTAAASGKDVAAAKAAIEVAINSVANAQAAVTVQASKTYVLDVSAVPTATATTTPGAQGELARAIKESFQKLHSGLFRDLFTLRDGPMTVARKAVQDALLALAGIPGVDEVSTAQTTSN